MKCDDAGPIGAAPPPVERIVHRRERAGHLPGRAAVERGRRGAAERIVRALLVVFDPERIEAALLRTGRPRRRPRRVALEDAMKLLMRSVLLGTAGIDPFDADPQLHPPHA